MFVEIFWEEKNKNEIKLVVGVSIEPESFVSRMGWLQYFS